MPKIVFGESVVYSGGVVFSRNSAWYITFQETNVDGKARPFLVLFLMDGDGHTKGGAEIGKMQIRFNLETKLVEIKTSKKAEIASDNKELSMEDFKEQCPSLAKALLEYQVKN